MSVNDLGAGIFDVIFTSHNVSAYSQPVWPAVYWANCRACDDHVMSVGCEIEAPFCWVGVHVAVSHFAVSHIAVSHFAVSVRFSNLLIYGTFM